MFFETFGPFEVPKNWILEQTYREWKREFWDGVNSEYENWGGLHSGIGCYAFCLRHGKRSLPWYVGQTVNVNGFQDETFTSHKVQHLQNLILLKPRHTVELMLFALVTPERWTLSQNRSEGKSAIEWLETTLIGMSLAQNPDISNSSKTRFHRDIYVNGLWGSQSPGRPDHSAAYAKEVWGIGKA